MRRRHRQRPFRFQPRPDSLESRRLLSTVYSTNWSGYGAATHLSSPASGAVTEVSGSWVVPTVTAPSRHGTYYSAVWVGIDGLSDSTVEQIGTEQDVSGSRTQYDAWWEMYSSGLGQPEQVISGFTVKPGDSISASVTSTGSGNFVLAITDATTDKTFTTTQNTNNVQSPTAAQSSAEWIVEAPTVGGGQASLANFGTVTISNASATISSATGAINDTAWQNEAIDMVNSRGSLLDSTSALNSSGTQFTVSYGSTAAAANGGSGLAGGAMRSRAVATNPVSLAPQAAQPMVVYYGVIPTGPVKKDGSGPSGSSQAS